MLQERESPTSAPVRALAHLSNFAEAHFSWGGHEWSSCHLETKNRQREKTKSLHICEPLPLGP